MQGIVFLFLLLSKCSSLCGQVPDMGGLPAAPNLQPLQDMAYKRLSPEAFFSMKDKLPNPVPPVIPIGPERPLRPGSRPGKPVRPGMGPMGPAMGLSTPVGMKGYEHFDLSILDDMSRQSGYIENYAAEIQHSKANDELIIYNLCFALSYIWRRGRESIRKYFHLRDIYHNHLPFEVGYLTHVIMSKYQTMLELYEFSASLSKAPKKERGKKQEDPPITTVHLTIFQKTIVEDGLTVQHLCNMLHELKNKYSFQPYDPGNRFDIPPPGYSEELNKTTPEPAEEHTTDDGRLRVGKKHPKLGKGYIAKKMEEAHKIIDETVGKRKKEMQETREFYKKHGYMPTTARVAQQPMRLWSPNLDYGLSGEEDW